MLCRSLLSCGGRSLFFSRFTFLCRYLQRTETKEVFYKSFIYVFEYITMNTDI
jgi:hypothetical protein